MGLPAPQPAIGPPTSTVLCRWRTPPLARLVKGVRARVRVRVRVRARVRVRVRKVPALP